MPRALADTDARIDWLLEHPDMSDWLKQALRAARTCEPMSVLNDLQILNAVLPPYAEARLQRHSRSGD